MPQGEFHSRQEDGRIKSLEGDYKRLDSKVSHIGEDLAGVKSTIDNQSVVLNQIAARINAPDKQNYFAMVSTAVSVIVVLAGFVLFSLAPLHKGLDSLAAAEVAHRAHYQRLLVQEAMVLKSVEFLEFRAATAIAKQDTVITRLGILERKLN
jgi:hypothetical protein